MRRFGRWVFNGVAIISFVVCAATITIWIRSYFRCDGFDRTYVDLTKNNVEINYQIYDPAGTAYIVRNYFTNHIRPQNWPWRYRSNAPVFLPWYPRPFGYNRHRLQTGQPADRIQINVRFWLAALMFALLPSFWLYRWYRYRVPANGFCPECGYDLRATPDRCPECGKITVPSRPI
jgi:hypothetical protein